LSKTGNDLRARERMSWDDVRIFVVVAEQKSVNRAANVLNVTPGMVSRRLDELEASLDVRLFNRTPSGMVLTPDGEDMLDRALSMQRFAESIEELVRGRDRREEGMVTLRAPDGLTGYWIAPRLPEFQNENPKIRLTLDCGTLVDYVGADPDIVITPDKDDTRNGDVAEPIAVLHYVFVASSKYVATFGSPKSAASAAEEHRTLKHVAQTYQREAWDARALAIESLASFSLVTNSSHAFMSVLLAGGGVGTVPSAMVHLHPDLQIIGPDIAFPIQLWMVIRKEAQSSVRVQKVAQWLRSVFDTKVNPWYRDEFVRPPDFAAELAAVGGRTAPIESEKPAARAKRKARNSQTT
jgi:DNA-binding transcriptional LysR family regulator